VSQNEEILKKPCELIHPFGPAAELFSEEDHRFPVGNGLRDANRLYVLEKLGMVKDLDWIGIHERAQSIAKRDFLAETERSRKLIGYMNKRIYQLPSPGYYSSRFQLVKFLPVLREPADEYFLPWKGSNCFLNCLFSSNDVFLPKDAELCGSSCLIVNTCNKTGCGKLNDEVKNLLGFSKRLPKDTLVIRQLDEAIKFWSKLSEEEKQETAKRFAIESVCKKIYGFFNKRVADKAKNQCSQLGERNWLFLEGKFVQSKKVAYTSNGNGAPFLFTLPWNYVCDYRHLFEAMHIKQTFDDKDYISALYELKSTKKDCFLTEDELQIAIFFITQINVENPTLKNYIGNIPLPDTNGILRRSQDVVVNLSLWLKDPDDNLKVHEKIPPQTAHALGAKPLKNVILKKCSHRIGYGESFGQHEKLTDRLNGILEGYPPDGILKELVQNADDAEASEIHFIHDTRSLGCEKVAIEDETCEEIQGPALCVYNDRPFTKKDVEGIKKLGIGSKRDTIEMTGKYGIGFNSVYHLTDCPSFLSNDETLVILDPHCRYVLDEDPGKLFKLTTKFRNDCSDTLDGYLADHFNLQGSTMFRFPLRREKNESKISNISHDMDKLIQTFQKEARKSLLFLNHVKKITLSKIHPNGEFEEIYRVETMITPENENKRREMAQKIYEFSDTPTAEIRWEGASYTLTVKENKREVEKWLIQKCIGSVTPTLSTADEKQSEIADGRELGVLPRGGLAALLWPHSSASDKQDAFGGIVYCFLPLPENYTNLPVHVNGHFVLDSTRRRLWTDTDGTGPKCKWNHFMNTCVLPPAYAALILEARNHLCDDEDDNQLSRYHALFPKDLSNTPWETLTTELYRYLGQTRAKVLPLLVPTESENQSSTSILNQAADNSSSTLSEENMDTVDTSAQLEPVHVTCTEWLSADQAYFKSFLKDNLLHLFIRIGVPVLLHAPYLIYEGFKSAGITSHKITPRSVIDFLRLRAFKCKIGNLPKKLETTAVKCIPDLSTLIKYCCKLI
jgi:sacsin